MSSDLRTQVLDSKCSAKLSLEAAPVEDAGLGSVIEGNSVIPQRLVLIKECVAWAAKGLGRPRPASGRSGRTWSYS